MQHPRDGQHDSEEERERDGREQHRAIRPQRRSRSSSFRTAACPLPSLTRTTNVKVPVASIVARRPCEQAVRSQAETRRQPPGQRPGVRRLAADGADARRVRPPPPAGGKRRGLHARRRHGDLRRNQLLMDQGRHRHRPAVQQVQPVVLEPLGMAARVEVPVDHRDLRVLSPQRRRSRRSCRCTGGGRPEGSARRRA